MAQAGSYYLLGLQAPRFNQYGIDEPEFKGVRVVQEFETGQVQYNEGKDGMICVHCPDLQHYDSPT
jgi:hypothetical protein